MTFHRISLVFLGLFFAFSVHSQWAKVGINHIDKPGLHGLYADSINDVLIAFGQVVFYDSSGIYPKYSHATYKLSNDNWDTLEMRNNAFLGGKILDIIWYKGKYYATGGFGEIGSSKSRFWATYENSKWNSSNLTPDDAGVVFKVFNDTLYVGGVFSNVDSLHCPGLVKFDGASFSNVKGESLLNYPRVYDIEWFNNGLVVSGFLSEHPLSDSNFLLYYKNGIKTIPKGWRINTFSNVAAIEKYKGSLYVSGNFSHTDGTSLGRNIVMWDGKKWHRLGTGCDGAIDKMIVFNNELIVTGVFTYCDGVNAHHIAKWNGQQWCSFSEDTFNWLIDDIEVWNDTLYVVGRFTELGVDSINYLAKWTGGDSSFECGPIRYVGIDNSTEKKDQIQIFPNPTAGHLTINGIPISGQLQVRIRNSIGQMMNSTTFENIHSSLELDLPYPNGLYFIEIVSGDYRIVRKIIKE